MNGWFRIGIMSVLAVATMAFAEPAGAKVPAYDLLVKGGTIIDGTGRPAYTGEVAIRGGYIAAVGRLEGARASRIIEAKGRIVSPGFINTHSHANINAVATAVNMLTQGVTAEFINADGAGTSDLDHQLSEFAANGLALNLGAYAGFNGAWTDVVGLTDRKPTHVEIGRMREILAGNLAKGAWGISAGLDYKPGYFAAASDVVRVVSVAAPWRTHFTNHDRLRPEQNYSSHAGIKETVDIANQAGLLPMITHIKVQGAEMGQSKRIIALLDESAARGKTGIADVYPYLAGYTGLGDLLLPGWALEGGRSAMLERFKDAALRHKASAEVERAIALRFSNPGNVLDMETGRTVAAWAADWKTGAGETVIRLLEEKDRFAILTFGAESDLITFLRYPASAITCDCGAMLEQRWHPRAYGTYPRFLGRYVRDQRLMSWEEAVRKMTGLPAQILGMNDRGLLAPGMAADITIFDPATIVDHATYEAPSALSSGIDAVIVNGKVALEQGKPTGTKGGSLLRRDSHMPSRPLSPFGSGLISTAGTLRSKSGEARVKVRLSQLPSAPFASGLLRFDNDREHWRLARAGIIQTAPGWSSITATMTNSAGAVQPIVVTLDSDGMEQGKTRTVVQFQGMTFTSP